MVSVGMTTEPFHPLRLDSEVTRIQKMIDSPELREMRRYRESRNTGIRPRNAATLILIDRESPRPRILMGKRHHSLAFMPGALVFPGGSVDRTDGDVEAVCEMPDATLSKIVANMRGRASVRAARGLGMAAIRELAEETGLLIGERKVPSISFDNWRDFHQAGITPSLAGFTLLARAITPPGPPRRFDTWFFVLDASTVAHWPESGFDPSGELEALQWISPQEAIKENTREITRVMLVELMNRLTTDPELDPAFSVPFYRLIGNRFKKSAM